MSTPHSPASSMPDLVAVLSQPSQEGCRVLALDALARTTEASEVVQREPSDHAALHGMRVQLTRLRATLQIYRPELGNGLGRRDLRRLHAALGTVRDLDMVRDWLRDAYVESSSEMDESVQWLLARVERRRARLAPDLASAVAHRFVRHRAHWQHRLSHYTIAHQVGETIADPPLAAIVVQRAHHAMQRLRVAMKRAMPHPDSTESPDFNALHRVRIHIKRMRSLLLPWHNELPALQPLLGSFAAAQDTLGAMHDALTVAEVARRAAERAFALGHDVRRDALLGIVGHAESVASDRRAAFLNGWLSGGVDAAFPELSDATDSLTLVARAGQEIERKFLLREAPPHALSAPGVRIAQGWLPGERLQERLRRSVHPDGHVTWTRTVKVGTGVSRVELEEATDAVLFESLWPLTSGARVEKVRHAVPDGAYQWEIDVFLDRTLILAEIELPSANAPIAFPEWLLPHVVREVTGESEFVNVNLARDLRRGADAS